MEVVCGARAQKSWPPCPGRGPRMGKCLNLAWTPGFKINVKEGRGGVWPWAGHVRTVPVSS